MSYTNEPITGKQRKVLNALVDGPKSSNELADVLFGDDPDGGPMNAKNAVAAYVFYVKQKLRPGWAIEFIPGTYQLVRR